jgi:anaerobic ribonucleoside-triphosphate reductase
MTEQERQSWEVKRQRCTVYSRTCGYFAPVRSWNDGKQAEYFDRKTFVIKGETT